MCDGEEWEEEMKREGERMRSEKLTWRRMKNGENRKVSVWKRGFNFYDKLPRINHFLPHSLPSSFSSFLHSLPSFTLFLLIIPPQFLSSSTTHSLSLSKGLSVTQSCSIVILSHDLLDSCFVENDDQNLMTNGLFFNNYSALVFSLVIFAMRFGLKPESFSHSLFLPAAIIPHFDLHRETSDDLNPGCIKS